MEQSKVQNSHDSDLSLFFTNKDFKLKKKRFTKKFFIFGLPQVQNSVSKIVLSYCLFKLDFLLLYVLKS